MARIRHVSAPPVAPRGAVVDVLHGVDVPDPYRWLEDPHGEDTQAFVAAHAARTRAWLDALPQRAALRRRLEARWDHPRASPPWRRGERWFQMRNSGLQQQAVLHVMAAPDVRGEVLLDPNTLSDDGTVGLGGLAVSRDGTRLAWARSDAGSDWLTWKVRDVAARADLDDEVAWSKFSPAAWTNDASGFFYGSYEPPPPDAVHEATTRDQRLRWHRVGATEDPIVLVRPDQPEWGFDPHVTFDGCWLVVSIWQGTEPRNRVWLGALDGDPAAVEVRPWLDAFDAAYTFAGTLPDGRLLVRTDRDAPRGRLLAIPPDAPDGAEEVVAEDHSGVLESARIVGGQIVTTVLVDASSRLRVHEPDGTLAAEIPLPELGTVTEVTGRPDDEVVHFGFTSFAQAGAIHRHDLTTRVTTEVSPPTLRAAAVVTERVSVRASDGADVPLFVVRRHDVTPDGDCPTLLYGYGGFEIPLTPEAKVWWLEWLDLGGVLAVACCRGGGEYGRAWHDAGRLANKPNTFTDFLACAHWLVDAGWTRPAKLAANGGSNGGLTVAAAMIREPGAFGAVIPEVGVLDLYRFHRFTIGWGWVSDYGSADDPAQFEVLRTYSPLHTLVEGTAYPPVMLLTSDTDDRVVPAHSLKFAAALQHAQGGDAPVLLRVETRAGHGAGTPTAKMIDARADVLAFLTEVLGVVVGYERS